MRLGMSELFTSVEGEGRPIVLLHAGVLDSRMFDKDVPSLACFTRVLRYDRSGSGRSPSAATPVDRVGELHEVATGAFGTRPALLVGSSFGGQLAVDYALAHPRLVAGLLLIGPGLTGVAPSDELRQRMAALIAAAHRGADALADAWLANPHHAPGGLPPATADLVATMLADNRKLLLAGSESAPSRSAVERLHQLRHRGIVVVGDRDDAYHRALAERIASEAQRLELRRVYGAGHYPSLERDDWLPSTVRDVIHDNAVDPRPRG
jgi:3-oxoadipate enol-lactonase